MELVQDLAERGKINIIEAFIGGTFVPAKKRIFAVGQTKRGKGTKSMEITDTTGFPVAAHIKSASLHEVKLIEATIGSGYATDAPDRLVGDKAYDRDGLDTQFFEERQIEFIAPHK